VIGALSVWPSIVLDGAAGFLARAARDKIFYRPGQPTALPSRLAYMDGRQNHGRVRRAVRDRIGALLRSQYDAVRSAGVPARLASLVDRFTLPWPAKKSAAGAPPEERVDRFMPRYPPAKNSADGTPPEK
jgi:hypothetical protein